MARALRTDFPGAVHHVTSRGNERRPIFFDDRDREAFLEFLGQAVKRFGWSLAAFVLMTNHFHLVIQTPEPNLSRGMQWFNTAYVVWLNRRHRRSGHLYGGRFKAVVIEKETYFLEVLRYVVLNPVRAGMVGRPEDFRWSSYRATAGLEPAPDWLDVRAALDPFAPRADLAAMYYQDFVAAKIGSPERLWDKLIHGIFLGSQRWARALREKVESKPRSSDHPKTQRAIGRPKMHAVIEAVSVAAGESAASIRAMRGGSLRRLAAWIGWHEGWITLRSIAAALRLRSEGHVSNLIRRCELEFAANRQLLVLLDRALATLRT
jgi:REP element-mobilizing transposase RayT